MNMVHHGKIFILERILHLLVGYELNPPLFSVCNGTVEKIEYGSALGNQIVIKDSQTNLYWRYCHMQNASSLNVGDTVTTATQVGIMR